MRNVLHVLFLKATVLAWWMTDSTQQKHMCIPDNQETREKLLAEAHDTQLSSHLGVKKTVAQPSQLKRRFWWPAMAESVAA